MKKHSLRSVLALSVLASTASLAAADEEDTFHLTDEPGNWFKSDATGTPFTVVQPGDEVDFVIGNCCTNTRHTVTLLVRPEGSAVEMDQGSSQNGTLSVEFDVPGVYVFVCKVHPYMTAVVGVTGPDGQVPPVTAGSLPFLQHLGVASLPAASVLDVITTVAPDDATKQDKWQIFAAEEGFEPAVPGVGEVWIDSQFERVPGQEDENGVAKPGTITVIDAATFEVEGEVDGRSAQGQWNNPHNMWADFSLSTIYNSNWFGKWINKIDRVSGSILDTIQVGEAPTHIITIPIQGGQKGWLTIPISADNDMVKVSDGPDGLEIEDSEPTGEGETHPHGHWLTCGDATRTVVPNVFTGVGVEGSISIMDTLSGDVLVEFEHDVADPLRSALLMPIAAGECHVDGVHTAYVANAVSGKVTVIDVDDLSLVTNIPVTLAPDGQTGLDLLHTLQVPIQTPVSPDERWVATAVLSLTTVPTSTTGTPDHVAIIDTHSNQVVAFVPTPAGTHGANWGAKQGGGYYAWVTCQHANVAVAIDPDPNGDGDGSDAAVVGRVVLANGSPGAGVTDGTGGQGVKPLPMTHDGWIQETVALSGTPALSAEVESWIAALTPQQKNPVGPHELGVYCTAGTSASGCTALIGATGAASASAPSGFVVAARSVEGAKDGIFFFGQNGRQGNPWGNGTSFQCVVPPVHRGGLLPGGGTNGACDGAFSQDLNAHWCPGCEKPHHAPSPGLPLQVQLWYRDPLNTSNQTTSLSDAIEVAVGL